MNNLEGLTNIELVGGVERAVEDIKNLKGYDRQHKIEIVETNIGIFQQKKGLPTAEPYIRLLHYLLNEYDNGKSVR